MKEIFEIKKQIEKSFQKSERSRRCYLCFCLSGVFNELRPNIKPTGKASEDLDCHCPGDETLTGVGLEPILTLSSFGSGMGILASLSRLVLFGKRV